MAVSNPQKKCVPNRRKYDTLILIVQISGSGIGLEQVGKRLELTYPGRYEWKHGISEDGKEYKSVLTINY